MSTILRMCAIVLCAHNDYSTNHDDRPTLIATTSEVIIFDAVNPMSTVIFLVTLLFRFRKSTFLRKLSKPGLDYKECIVRHACVHIGDGGVDNR